MNVFRLASFFSLLCFTASLLAQNPHGADMKIDCASCHSSKGWEIDAAYWQSFDPAKPRISQVTGTVYGPDTLRFHHGKTGFALTGQHIKVDCRTCHESLVFSETASDCISCHADVHQQTAGTDCARCHTPANWLVDNVSDLHLQSGFPLTGVHQAVSCEACHTAASSLQFNRIGNDCISCHLHDFQASTNPNHQQAGFSTDCLECHNVSTPDWGTDRVNHEFFPLTKGHEISDCRQCHLGGDFANTPNNCNACHQPDFAGAQTPNHVSAQFSTDCATCHTTDADWMPAAFTAHDGAYFPIYSGKHQGQWSQCTECHTNPSNYAENSCVVCHINPETNDGHSGVNGYVYENSACLACHPTGDAGTAFDHNTTSFPLTGAHQEASCLECHAAGYTGTPTQCVACHTADFNATANPNHVALNIPTDCAMCHTTAAGWEPATFPIHNTFYPLNGAHAAVANDCANCHNGNYTNTPNTCNGCHNADYNATTSPNHAAAQFPTDCATCHTETAWAPSTFDHNAIYPFTGAHVPIANDCDACHNGNYTNTPNTCNGCHNADYNATTSPNHAAAQFPTDCATCHIETAWAPSTFDHNTIYPFTGAHVPIANDCDACHNGNYTNTPNTCNGCHTADFNATTNPNHVALNIPTDCAMCHTTAAGWDPATFPIHNTFYPLNGAHAAVANDCATCHNGNYTNTPNTCNGCHNADYNATTSPNHAAAQFPTDCATCHTETAWAPSTFDHNAIYPFTGAHVPIANDCDACHNGNYTNTPNTCNGCHNTDYNATTSPNHAAAQFPTDCATCHTETAWAPATFDHNTVYPITGAHVPIANDCATCHNGNYTNTPNTCNGCHNADYNATTSPNHAAAQFPTDCATCHTETAWAPSVFDHNAIYPFTGAHVPIANDCDACHNGNYTNTPNTCNGCHQTDYNTSSNPNHVALNLSNNCATCHTTAPDWTPATFAVHNTYWPLTGAHASASCNECHANGNYNNTPTTCFGCHASDFNSANDPNHVAAGFPNTCQTCHSVNAWAPSTFNHNAIYPFTGAHVPIANDCDACHNGNYTNTPNTCNGCHQTDYNTSSNPNHVALNLSNNCATCHTTAPDWTPATFAVHNTYWPLTGAHASASCNECHANGNYNNTPTTCFGCHASDFNSANDPNHIAAGFPNTCQTCHSVNAWAPSTFNHNAIYPFTGAHVPIANDCDACHNGNYTNTPNTCNGCHQTDYNTSSNPNHVSLNLSNNCASCHTTAPDWTPATFAVHNTYWPLTGAHASASCNECHANGNYNNTPTTCFGCHASDYNGANNPDHGAAQFPTTCQNCHTTNAWDPSTWNHDQQYFPIFSGTHDGEWNQCVDCHTTPNNFTLFSCIDCHEHDNPTSLGQDHQGVSGYQYVSTACYSCHPDGND